MAGSKRPPTARARDLTPRLRILPHFVVDQTDRPPARCYRYRRSNEGNCCLRATTILRVFRAFHLAGIGNSFDRAAIRIAGRRALGDMPLIHKRLLFSESHVVREIRRGTRRALRVAADNANRAAKEAKV
jgi:hypothetical protein